MGIVTVDLKKMTHNIRYLVSTCREKGLGVNAILKGPYPEPMLVRRLVENGVDTIGLSCMPENGMATQLKDNNPVLITLPSIHSIEEMVGYFDTSYNSQIQVIKKINDALIRQNRKHKIILMIDTGDLREGMQPSEVTDMVRQILELKNRKVEFYGIATNLGCCAGMLPDRQNIEILNDLAEQIETEIQEPLKTVSIGGSVYLDWLATNSIPDRINQIRLGEAIFLGNIPVIEKKHPDLYDDLLIFKGDVLEASSKNVRPLSPDYYGKNAFGFKHEFRYTGLRKRAIMNFGMSDTWPQRLIPLQKGLEIVSVNSNYTVIDYTDSDLDLKTGDFLEFKMSYMSMLQSFISPQTKFVYVQEE